MDTLIPFSMSSAIPALVDMALKGAVLLALAGTAAAALRRASAAMRHLVWSLAMAGLLTLPVMSALLPQWQVLPQWLALSDAEELALPAPAVTQVAPAPASPAPAAIGLAPAPTEHDAYAAAPSSAGATVKPSSSSAAGNAASAGSRERDSRPLWLCLAWMLGGALLLLRVLAGRLALWRLCRSAQPMERGSWAALLQAMARKLRLRRRITLLRTHRPVMPMTWGIRRARILLPGEADGWSADRQRVVLFHEMAHVHRWDSLAQLVTNLACALHWFNPLVWVARRRMVTEAEQACDDLVLAAGFEPSDYAQHLLQIASGLRDGSMTSGAAIAMARPSKLEGRLLAVLDAERSRRALTRLVVLIGLLVAVGIGLPLAAARAQETDVSIVSDAAAGPGTEKPREDAPRWITAAEYRELRQGAVAAALPDEDVSAASSTPATAEKVEEDASLPKTAAEYQQDIIRKAVVSALPEGVTMGGYEFLTPPFRPSPPDAVSDRNYFPDVVPAKTPDEEAVGAARLVLRFSCHYEGNEGPELLTEVLPQRLRAAGVYGRVRIVKGVIVGFLGLSSKDGGTSYVGSSAVVIVAVPDFDEFKEALGKANSAPPAFGPVIEITLKALEGRVAELVDLETGLGTTYEHFGENDRETHRWIREHGVDMLGIFEKGMFGALCFDMAAVPVNAATMPDLAGNPWETIPAQAVTDNWPLNQIEPKPVSPLVPEMDKASAYLFQTREGGIGLVQIIGATDNPRGVKIRYKMVQQSAAGPSASANKIAETDDRVEDVDALLEQLSQASQASLSRMKEGKIRAAMRFRGYDEKEELRREFAGEALLVYKDDNIRCDCDYAEGSGLLNFRSFLTSEGLYRHFAHDPNAHIEGPRIDGMIRPYTSLIPERNTAFWTAHWPTISRRESTVSIRVAKDTLDGKEVCRVEHGVARSPKNLYRYYIDPAQGGAVIRYEALHDFGEGHVLVYCEKAEMQPAGNERWYLKRFTVEGWRPDGSLERREECEIKEFDFDSRIPEDTFTWEGIGLPPGTMIVDQRLGNISYKYQGPEAKSQPTEETAAPREAGRAQDNSRATEPDGRVPEQVRVLLDAIKDGEDVRQYWRTRYAMVNTQAPELDVAQWFNSEPLRLEDLRGKVVLLEFWGTKCGPCVGEIPKINKLHERGESVPLTVIAVHYPGIDPDELKKFIEETGIRYPVCIDREGELGQYWHGATFEKYSVSGLPGTVLIDIAGRVRSVMSPPDEWTLEKLISESKEGVAGSTDVDWDQMSGVKVAPDALNFGKVKAGQEVTKSVFIFKPDDPGFRVELRSQSTSTPEAALHRYEEDDSVLYELRVSVGPGAAVGEFAREIVLHTSDSARPEVVITVRGEVQE